MLSSPFSYIGSVNSQIQFISDDDAREMLIMNFPWCMERNYNEFQNLPNELYNAECERLLDIITKTFNDFGKDTNHLISNFDISAALNNQLPNQPMPAEIYEQFEAIALVSSYENAEALLDASSDLFDNEYRCRILIAAMRVAVYLGNIPAHDHLGVMFNQMNLGDYFPKIDNPSLYHNSICFIISLVNNQLDIAKAYLDLMRETPDENVDNQVKSLIVQNIQAGLTFPANSLHFISDLKNMNASALWSTAELEYYFGLNQQENHTALDASYLASGVNANYDSEIEDAFEITSSAHEPALSTNQASTTLKPDFRKLLENKQLIDSVELVHNEAKLNVRAQYNNPEHLKLIHSMFGIVRQFSPELRAIGKFARRKNISYLLLNNNHSFKNGNDILEVLTKHAARKQLPIRKALANGELIKNLILNGNIVTFDLADEYDDKKHYSAIYYAFQNLCHGPFRSDSFREKFISPRQSIAAPTLLLRDNHGFKNADEVLAFLKACAISKKKKSVAETIPSLPPILHAYQLLDSNINGTLPSNEEAMPSAMKLR
jgi:hypothetical protein